MAARSSLIADDTASMSEASTPQEPMLYVDHLILGYGAGIDFVPAVRDVSFAVRRGETAVLLGPSGCGKSTILKAVAGFLRPSAGEVRVDGRPVTNPSPDRAVVFQEFDQLFPWRTVLDNIAYPLRRTGRSRREADERARHWLGVMHLDQAADRFPHQLSGGMKQCVAIARALALEPAVLLMDEPFGALEPRTRLRLQLEFLDLAGRTGATALFVTHSIAEAVLVGSDILILDGTPSSVRAVVDARAGHQDRVRLRLAHHHRRRARLRNLQRQGRPRQLPQRRPHLPADRRRLRRHRHGRRDRRAVGSRLQPDRAPHDRALGHEAGERIDRTVRTTMPTRRLLLTGALASACPMIRVARADAGPKLVIATQRGLGYAPLIVVKQNRWLEDAVPGLQVEWRVISSSVAIREAMLAGEVQVGCGSVAPFLVGRDRGFRTRLVSAPETVFTSTPAGVEALGAFMLDSKFLRAPAGRLDELTFRL